jgi:hypothetical protein
VLQVNRCSMMDIRVDTYLVSYFHACLPLLDKSTLASFHRQVDSAAFDPQPSRKVTLAVFGGLPAGPVSPRQSRL